MLDAEIIVSDSSKDNSPIIASELGAKVIKHNKKGYGIAYLEGFRHAKGKYIFCADSDGSYDFSEIPRFIEYLKEGYDFVIGNRFKGNISKNAMPFLHRHLGNPVLSGTLMLLFRSKIHDAHCGMRAITKEAIERMKLRTTGMEFASEMVIKAAKNNLRTKELSIDYRRRIGKSHLSSFSDGWRHLRFMFMFAPDYLFMVPGVIILLCGLSIMALLMAGPVKIDGITLYTHPMIIGSFLTIVGYQIINTGLHAKAYSVSVGFEKKDRMVDAVSKFVTFESGIIIGAVIMLLSFSMASVTLVKWVMEGFPSILKTNDMILFLTLGVLGVQTIFSSFFLSILLIKKGG
jgi:glycosyltransferase involved in cell wall biosynthesis